MKKIWLFTFWVGVAVAAWGQRAELVLPIGIDGLVSSLEFSPDRRWLIAAAGGRIFIIDSKNGQILHILKDKDDYIDGFSLHPKGRLIAVQKSFSVEILDLSTYEKITVLSDTCQISSAKFSKSGDLLLTTNECNIFKENEITLITSSVKIWEVSSGKNINTIVDYPNITAASFSIDETSIITAKADGNIAAWNLKKEQVEISSPHTRPVRDINCANDGVHFATAGFDNYAVIFKLSDKKNISKFELGDRVNNVMFSPDSKMLGAVSSDSTARIWDVASGKLLFKIYLPTWLKSISFSPDGKYFALGGVDLLNVYETSSGNQTLSIASHVSACNQASFNRKATKLVVASQDGIGRIWNLEVGSTLQALKGHTDEIRTALFNPSESQIVTASQDSTIKIWDVNTGGLLANFKRGWTNSCSISPSGNNIFVSSSISADALDYQSGSVVKSFEGHSTGTWTAVLNSNENLLVTSSWDSTAIIWDFHSGDVLHKLIGDHWCVNSAIFSPDSYYVVTASQDGVVRIWETNTGNLVDTLLGKSFIDVSFNPDGQFLAACDNDGSIYIWNFNDKSLIKIWRGHLPGHGVSSIRFSSDGKLLLTAGDYTTRIWETSSGRELVTLTALDSADWVVTTPSGLFDASPGAMKLLYYVVNTPDDEESPWNVIELEQLKERYYEPGLLSKALGYTSEPLRSVETFGEVKLHPSAKVSAVDSTGAITIRLKNKGGGIGKVHIFINEKEVESDARPAGFDDQSDSLTIRFDLRELPYFLADFDNKVEVRAENSEGYLLGRGTGVSYSPAGIRPSTEEPPKLYLLSCGVSDYTGTEIDLRYAAKDATDMAAALKQGGKSLFGASATKEWLLTDQQSADTLRPTLANLRRAFEEIGRQAKAQDVVAVYLAGHGINWGGQDGDFYYLTQDAYTANPDAYNDPAIRQNATISSRELTELFKKIPALKQVLIIDACASGKAGEKMENLLAQRNVPSSTLRALDRMKDRTGMHIITGCTADAVSYEANRYGQGVLTYSLLEGMKGAALREERFVDVSQWFQYARERVPQLAKEIGGIQEPRIFQPYGAQSFDVGRLEAADKEAIPLAQAKPVFLQSAFFDEANFNDPLNLGQQVDAQLLDFSTAHQRGRGIVFIPVRDFPDGYYLRGAYSSQGQALRLNVNVFKGTEKKATFQLTEKSGNAALLPAMVMEELKKVRLN